MSNLEERWISTRRILTQTILGSSTRPFDLPRISTRLSEEYVTRWIFQQYFRGTKAHQNAFNDFIPSTDVSQIANCTSCTFSEDLSNYWTANMYFKARNGSYKRVPQVPNRFLSGEVGGMTVYYTSSYDNSKVTAFKPVSSTSAVFRVWKASNRLRARASACLLETPRRGLRLASPSGMRSASGAIMPRILGATTWLRALTQRSILSNCQRSLALAAFARQSGSQREQ